MFSVTSDLLSAWAGVLVVFGAAILVTVSAMVWIIFFRKNARRRHKRRRLHNGEYHQLNPTLAQIGGLPPPRENGKSSRPRIPTLTSRS
jgi:hypothetical protein